MNFGTLIEGRNGCKMSKNSELEILITHLNNVWIFQLWPQISQKSVPENFFEICVWNDQVEGGEQEYGRKPEPEVVFAAILAKKNDFLGFSGDF